jgi:HAD superfamily hydrolase (TIGR01549 family)
MTIRRPIAAVCFDVFGTLISYNGQRTNPYRNLLAAVPAQEGRHLPILTRDVSVDIFAGELGLTHLIPVIRQELNDELSGLGLFPDTEETIAQLRARNLKIGLCSNLAKEYGESVRRLLLELDAYVFSYEVGVTKPDPAIYKTVCTTLGHDPDEILFIGDSKLCDFNGPRSFGMTASWLDRTAGQTLLEAFCAGPDLNPSI